MTLILDGFVGNQIFDSSQLAGKTVVFIRSNYLPKFFTLDFLINFLKAKKQNYRFVIIRRIPKQNLICVGYRTAEYITSFATQLIIFCVQKQIHVQVHQSKFTSEQIVQWLKRNSVGIKRLSFDAFPVKLIDESKSKIELKMEAWSELGPVKWGPPIHEYRIVPTEIEAKLRLFLRPNFIPQYSALKRFSTPKKNELLGIPDADSEVLKQIQHHRPFL